MVEVRDQRDAGRPFEDNTCGRFVADGLRPGQGRIADHQQVVGRETGPVIIAALFDRWRVRPAADFPVERHYKTTQNYLRFPSLGTRFFFEICLLQLTPFVHIPALKFSQMVKALQGFTRWKGRVKQEESFGISSLTLGFQRT